MIEKIVNTVYITGGIVLAMVVVMAVTNWIRLLLDNIYVKQNK